MAGLDGIRNRIDPGQEYAGLAGRGPRRVGKGPQGDVFTPDVIETWLTYKRERELAPVNLRPVPYELFLYFDL